MEQSKRYDGLDILKTICAFLVVCIHAPFPGVFGEYFTALARVAVPLFFMISGFFFERIVSRHKEWKQIKKLLVLLILSNLLYFAFDCGKAIIKGNLSGFFHGFLTGKTLLDFLLLNESPFGVHLWYLGAILYVFLLAVCCRSNPKLRRVTEKLLPVLVPVLLLGDLILGKYSRLLWGREFPYILVRNFLFVGIPYFSIGVFLKKKEASLEKLRSRRLLAAALILLFCLTTILERWILVAHELNTTRDHYLSTTFLSLSLFAVFSGSAWNDWNRKLLKLLKLTGRKYSTMIYILHPLTIPVFSAAAGRIGVNGLYLYGRPVIVFLAAALLSALFYYVLDRITAGRKTAGREEKIHD